MNKCSECIHYSLNIFTCNPNISQLYGIKKFAKISNELAKLVQFTLENHIFPKKIPYFDQKNVFVSFFLFFNVAKMSIIYKKT